MLLSTLCRGAVEERSELTLRGKGGDLRYLHQDTDASTPS